MACRTQESMQLEIARRGDMLYRGLTTDRNRPYYPYLSSFRKGAIILLGTREDSARRTAYNLTYVAILWVIKASQEAKDTLHLGVVQSY